MEYNSTKQAKWEQSLREILDQITDIAEINLVVELIRQLYQQNSADSENNRSQKSRGFHRRQTRMNFFCYCFTICPAPLQPCLSGAACTRNPLRSVVHFSPALQQAPWSVFHHQQTLWFVIPD